MVARWTGYKILFYLTFATKLSCSDYCQLVWSLSQVSLIQDCSALELEYPDGHVESHETTAHNWITIVFRGRELESAAIWIILFCRALRTQVTIALCCQVGSFWKGEFSLGYDHDFPGRLCQQTILKALLMIFQDSFTSRNSQNLKCR